MTSDNPRTLSIGDVIKARPCVVTINYVTDSTASGHCRTCQVGHLISVPRYEDGQGPWQPVEPTKIECIECGVLQTHRVCELCFETSHLLDRVSETTWDVAVWVDGDMEYVIGRIDPADRKALVREILGQQTVR